MKVFIASDHAGWEAKTGLKQALASDYEVVDLGPAELEPSDDYPVYAQKVAQAIQADKHALGILICGSGQGMAMVANKFNGVRAAVAWNEAVARETRSDNDSNVLSLPSRFVKTSELLTIAKAWLESDFSGEKRHLRRIAEISELESHHG